MAKTPGLANQIDSYLTSKGSPMAGTGRIFVAAGKKHGVDPRLVVGIAGAESSFGKKNFAPHNAWGWGVHLDPQPQWPNWAQAISSVTAGISKGYIQKGLKTPAQIVKIYCPSSDGNDEAHWSNTVSTFMRELGAAPALTTTLTKVTPTSGSPGKTTYVKTPALVMPPYSVAPPVPSTAGLQGALLQNLQLTSAHGHGLSGSGLLSSVLQGKTSDQQADVAAAASYKSGKDAYEAAMKKLMAAGDTSSDEPQPTDTAETKGGQPTGSVFTGKTFKTDFGVPVPAATLTSIGTQHDTGNLAGFPAHDYMAPSGSAAVAPVSGQVVWLSGHDPAEGPIGGDTHGALGWSVYIKGNNGRTYYLTHLGTRDVKLGNIVKLGQKIGTVADWHQYGTPDHIHMGVAADGRLPDEAKAYWDSGSRQTQSADPDTSAWVKTAPGADRPGVSTNQSVRDAVAKIARQHGSPLTITTGTKHNQFVQGHPGRESQHWQGNAADILFGHGTSASNVDPALTRLGQDALIAAGMDPAEARKIYGGFHDVGGWNIGFNTMEGGNHYNHLHVGV